MDGSRRGLPAGCCLLYLGEVALLAPVVALRPSGLVHLGELVPAYPSAYAAFAKICGS